MAETFNQMIRFPKDLEPQIKAQAEKNGVSRQRCIWYILKKAAWKTISI